MAFSIFAGIAWPETSQFGVIFCPRNSGEISRRWDPRLRVWRAPPPRSTVLGSRSAARSPMETPLGGEQLGALFLDHLGRVVDVQ